MKLKTIINAIESLNKLSNMLLPAKDSFVIAKTLMAIEQPVNNYNIQRNKMIAKYGETADKINYTITNMDAYNKELTELENLEIDIKIEKIKLTEVTLIAPNDLYNLIDFVEVI